VGTPGAQRPQKSRVREYLTSVALLFCIAVVLLATMWPTPLDQGFEPSVQRFLEILHRTGVPTWFGYTKLEVSANVVMFIPIGFLTAMLLPIRVWWLSLILCPALSVAIEVTQGSLLAARFATPMDVFANSVGAVIGAIIAVAIRSIVYQRDQKVIALALWQRGVQF
jgi:glycopeptide antibiotics resistance protein